MDEYKSSHNVGFLQGFPSFFPFALVKDAIHSFCIDND